MDDEVQPLVAEQVAYYRARAGEYDNDIAGLDKDWDQSIDELPVTGGRVGAGLRHRPLDPVAGRPRPTR